MKRRRTLLSILASLCVQGLAAVASADLPAGWSVHTFAGRIHEIEAAGGVLACATDGGLLFYDRTTRRFAPVLADAGCTDRNCLTSNQLSSVSRDASGRYWLGTAGAGVVVFRPEAAGRRFAQFFALNTVPGGDLLADSVTCVEAWASAAVYVGTSAGVAQIDLAGAVESHNPEAARLLGQHIKGTRIRDLAADSLWVWVATDSGVSRYERRPPYAVQFLPDSLAGREALTLEILQGTPYAGTPVGLFAWQETGRYWRRVRNCSTCPQTPDVRVESVTRLADGRFFAGSQADVWMFTGFVWGRLSPPVLHLLGGRSFRSIVAVGDTVWTSQGNADGEGSFLEIWRPDPAPSGTWSRAEPASLPPSAVQALALAPAGDLWAGTRIGGVGRLAAAGAWCVYNGNDASVRANMSDPEGHVSALLAARDGRTWLHGLPNVGLSKAVDILRPDAGCDHARDAWAHVRPGEMGFGGRYWRALQDGAGNVYLLADGDLGGEGATAGLEIVAEDAARAANVREDELQGSAVGALAFETSSGAWSTAFVGVNNAGSRGLKRWRVSGSPFNRSDRIISTLVLPDTLDVSQYRDILVVPGTPRILWVGTESGVFEYDESSGRMLRALGVKTDAKPGLLSPDVKDLELDGLGNLWIATVRGLNRIALAGRPPGGPVVVDAFSTIEVIRELNAGSSVGQLYDPRRVLAPLPAAKVNALAYDAARRVLYAGTDAGIAAVEVDAIGRRPSVPLAQAIVYPNPARLDAGHEAVRVGRLGEPATVGVYTLDGRKVCELIDVRDGDVIWDLHAPSCLQGEFKIASGTYFVHIATREGAVVRPLVVIR